MRGCLKLLVKAGLALFLLVLVVIYFGVVWPFWGMPFNAQRRGNLPLTPAWALEPWLWEDDIKTADFVLEMLDGYEAHDIPVRTYLIDAPWAMRNNDFTIDESRYPNPEEFFGNLKERGMRLAFWMTCTVNSQNDATPIRDARDFYEKARDRGYLVGDGHQISWWRGRGGLIDYTNPEAMEWWHGMQQQIFDLGLDAWKLDDTATYFSSMLFGKIPIPYQDTHAGRLTTRQYMDLFYRKEYQHGLTQNPEFVTMSRSIDSPLPWAHPEGFAPQDASTLNWVGDNRHTWSYAERGLERAIWCILRSAKLGYNLPGSDIGGYHGGMDIQPELYIRWAQFAVFSGFFLNGGHGERRMWKRTPLELELIRESHWRRTELVPYIYCHVVQAHRGGPVLMQPVRGKYHYMFGNAFLVAPIYEDSLTRTVTLPPGRWRYLFDDLEVLEGDTTFTREFPLEEYPVFVQDGAIIPMNIARDYTGIGDESWAPYLTLDIYPHETSVFTVYHTDNSGKMDVTVEAGETIHITLEDLVAPHLLRVLTPETPTRVIRNDDALPEDAWHYDASRQRLIIKSALAETARYHIHFD